MARKRAKPRAFLTNQPEATHVAPGVAQWPVVRAYVPLRDAWLGSGFGSAGIVRQQPDGRWCFGFFTFSLLDQGINVMFGKEDMTPGEQDEMLASLRDQIPPWEEGDAQEAAAYIRGALALGERHGHHFPPEQTARWLAQVPRVPGSPREHLHRLIGARGLAPPGLWEIARKYGRRSEDIEEGKELLIYTTMTFDLEHSEAAAQALEKGRPEFQLTAEDDGERTFDWSRKYPSRHWSPLSLLRGRQSLGTVRVRPAELIAETKTLSWASRLTARLKDLLRDKIRLRGTTWMGVDELMEAQERGRH